MRLSPPNGGLLKLLRLQMQGEYTSDMHMTLPVQEINKSWGHPTRVCRYLLWDISHLQRDCSYTCSGSKGNVELPLRGPRWLVRCCRWLWRCWRCWSGCLPGCMSPKAWFFGLWEDILCTLLCWSLSMWSFLPRCWFSTFSHLRVIELWVLWFEPLQERF